MLDESNDLDEAEDNNEQGIATPEVAACRKLEAGEAIGEPDPVDPFKEARGP